MLAPLLLFAAAAAPVAKPLPVHVEGRVIREADGSLEFGWPGVSFESRFRGTGIRVRFDAPTDFLRLVIDGKEKMVFRRPGKVDKLFNDLHPGVHIVRL